jgi:enamine deaminase RidA (YjgF/YER057c/UK114 family)
VSRRLGEVVTGKAGSEHDREAARELARLVAIDMLATAAAVLSSLDAVRRVVKVTGMVNSTDSFIDHSYVIDGASSLLVDVFVDRGRHARSAFGVAQLPLGAAIELEAVLEIDGE